MQVTLLLASQRHEVFNILAASRFDSFELNFDGILVLERYVSINVQSP